MSSDDTATERVSTELLETLIRPVNVSELTPWPESPWDYDVGAATVRDSTFGKLRLPVVLNGEVLYGSQIVDAERIDPKDDGHILVIDLTELGWSKERATAAVLGEMTADRQAFVDDVMLAELVTTLHDQDAVMAAAAGWEGDDIQALLDRIEQDEHNVGLNDPDEVPEPPTTEPTTKPGDVWLLGDHRLVCGDATDPNNYPTKAALLVTDPPYGVSYADKNEYLNKVGKGNAVQAPIANDHLSPEDTQAVWIDVFNCCHDAMAPGASFYVTGAAMGDLLLLLLALKEAKLPPRHGLVWLKNNHVLGFTDYNYKHEPITFGWKDGGHKFYGDGTDKSVWEIDKPHASKLHPTMKPIELYERAIRNSSKRGELVLDPFAGSGTAIIACEQTGRICHAIELSPAYCDVICARYERHTGNKPIREATGEPVSFMDGDD